MSFVYGTKRNIMIYKGGVKMEKIIAIILIVVIIAILFVSCKVKDDAPQDDKKKYPVSVTVDHTVEPTENTIDIDQLYGNSTMILSCITDKTPYAYKVGEDVTFTIALKSGASYVSCEKIKIKLRYDGISEPKELYVSGETGCVKLTTQVAQPGFVLIDAEACNASGKAYPNIDALHGGAGADLKELEHNGAEPADFDSFWQSNIDELLKIDTERIKFKKIENYMPSRSNYDFYDVQILAVDDGYFFQEKGDMDRHDYVSGILAVPKNAEAGSCGIDVTFDGHGVMVSSIPENLLDGRTIVFDVLAHSIEANEKAGYYTAYQYNVLNEYGLHYKSETDPQNIYYKNMILRDLQALRFLSEYFGGDGEGGNIWNGTDFKLEGYSQGGFQTVAVAALADKVGVNVTYVDIGAPWLCDMASYCTVDSTAIASVNYPKGSYDVLAYFDSSLFAKRVTCDASVMVGLGDEATPAAGVTILYHSLASENKSMSFVQNMSHIFTSPAMQVYAYQ